MENKSAAQIVSLLHLAPILTGVREWLSPRLRVFVTPVIETSRGHLCVSEILILKR